MLEELTPLIIVPTFLAAHAVPSEFKGRQDEFVNLVINEMIPQVAAESLQITLMFFVTADFLLLRKPTGSFWQE